MVFTGRTEKQVLLSISRKRPEDPPRFFSKALRVRRCWEQRCVGKATLVGGAAAPELRDTRLLGGETEREGGGGGEGGAEKHRSLVSSKVSPARGA